SYAVSAYSAQPAARVRSLRGRRKNASTQEKWSQVRKRGEQECGERNAPQKERNTANRKRWNRWQGEEPETGDRHRTIRGARKRCEGPAEEIEQKEEIRFAQRF